MSDTDRAFPEELRAALESLARNREPMPKAHQIFRHGLQFHECALRCLELRDGQTFLFLPSLALLAFAVELYLKGLLVADTKPIPNRHDLNELFGNLAPEIQMQIADRYHRRHAQNLLDDLAGYSHLFTKIRYAYEVEGQGPIDMSGIAQLASSLYETWAVVQPNLICEGLVHDRISAAAQGIPIP